MSVIVFVAVLLCSAVSGDVFKNKGYIRPLEQPLVFLPSAVDSHHSEGYGSQVAPAPAVHSKSYSDLAPDAFAAADYAPDSYAAPAQQQYAFIPLSYAKKDKQDGWFDKLKGFYGYGPKEAYKGSQKYSKAALPVASYTLASAAPSTYAKPAPTYGAPEPAYAAPAPIPAPAYAAPAPVPAYVAPQATYSAPDTRYQAPSQSYAAPLPLEEYAAPAAVQPVASYAAPQETYAAVPAAEYNAPVTGIDLTGEGVPAVAYNSPVSQVHQVQGQNSYQPATYEDLQGAYSNGVNVTVQAPSSLNNVQTSDYTLSGAPSSPVAVSSRPPAPSKINTIIRGNYKKDQINKPIKVKLSEAKESSSVKSVTEAATVSPATILTTTASAESTTKSLENVTVV